MVGERRRGWTVEGSDGEGRGQSLAPELFSCAGAETLQRRGGAARIGDPCANPQKNFSRHSLGYASSCLPVLEMHHLGHSCVLSVKLWLLIQCHVLVPMTRHLGK